MSRLLLEKRKRIRIIFLIAGITAAGIIACQLYWVYTNYQTAKSNYFRDVHVSLWQSVDSCLVGQRSPLKLITDENPSIMFVVRQHAITDSGVRHDLSSANTTPAYAARLDSFVFSREQLPGVKSLVGRMFSMKYSTSISTDTLATLFDEQLVRNAIHEKFTLKVDTSGVAMEAGAIYAMIHINSKFAFVIAEPIHKYAFMIRVNIVPGLLSIFLITLSAFTLIYMSRTIKRQMQLDTMKTDFVNNTIHELRTPLTILRTSNEALARFGASHDETSLMRYLGINSLVINDLDNNIERILDFSKIEQGKRLPVMEQIDVLQVIKESQLRFSQIADAVIKVVAETETFIVSTDRFFVGVIISNLIDNAIKYSPDLPKITVTLTRIQFKWQLAVADEGKGIPKTALPFIFDKFYRVPTGDLHDVKGYGIGLAYVKQLVADLNGTIEVKSEEGHGTVFTITFNS